MTTTTQKREPVAVRLLPEVIRIGRETAKDMYGSRDKLGLLIENAVKVYCAQMTDEATAGSLLQKTEAALFHRVDECLASMEKRTVERVAGLVAKSAFETTLATILLESMKDSKTVEEARKVAAARLRRRFEKEGAEQIADLLEQNQRLEIELQELRKKANEAVNHFKHTVQEQKKQLESSQNNYAELVKWSNGLIHYLNEHSSGTLIRKKASELIQEYHQQHPRPRG